MTFKFFLSTVIVIGIRVIASLNSGHDPVKYNYLLSLTALYFLLKTENVTRPVEAAGGLQIKTFKTFASGVGGFLAAGGADADGGNDGTTMAAQSSSLQARSIRGNQAVKMNEEEWLRKGYAEYRIKVLKKLNTRSMIQQRQHEDEWMIDLLKHPDLLRENTEEENTEIRKS
ncbi:uncharacterized protein LOC136038391 [Artemia franciscana]|uniref:uncharacterized protein LOC136038391 n=1 Tax=Artemia franciscana TaxID=6661 RepID=UPI0032DBC072